MATSVGPRKGFHSVTPRDRPAMVRYPFGNLFQIAHIVSD
ncbi:MAG: hypothetical protein JWM05_2967 [Acidimicrobiales bacterium]|nr:hypothetical protein [Acidimicrobiales bacterium]